MIYMYIPVNYFIMKLHVEFDLYKNKHLLEIHSLNSIVFLLCMYMIYGFMAWVALRQQSSGKVH